MTFKQGTMIRNSLIWCGLAAGIIVSGSALGQYYPNRQIIILVGIAAGGITDVTTRQYAAVLSKNMDQNIIVEHRPIAGGAIAAAAVQSAAPDGYTLLSVVGSQFCSVPAMGPAPYALALLALVHLLDRHVPDPGGGDECLRADKVVDRALGRVLGRMGDGRKGDVHALGQICQRPELSAHISGAVAVDHAAHVGGDRVDGDQPDIAGVLDYLFELGQILVQQEHPLLVVLAD